MSLLNHSCDPNCSIVFNGPHLLLRAVRDIEAGEEVRFPGAWPALASETLSLSTRPFRKPVVPEGQLLIIPLLGRGAVTVHPATRVPISTCPG